MNEELTRALLETRTLAQARAWNRVVEAADAALAGSPENSLLLAMPPDIDVGGLPRWIAETAPALGITKTGTEALAADPRPGGDAERLVVVFECGKLMTADAVDVVQRICFSRPDGSYALVLRGAESLESPEDLELVERGAFRLLVPEPKDEWHGQELLESACYLWSDSSPKDFLAERIERDRAALAAWLRGPAGHGDALALQQALQILELADYEIDRPKAPDTDRPALSPARLYAALNDLSEVRRRLFARIDAEAPSIERQLTASLQTLEQDLLDGVHAYLAPRLPHFDPGRDEARLTSLVTEYISAAANAWKENAENILAVRSGELQSDTDSILHGPDWAIVNATVQSMGGAGDYPDALMENLSQSPQISGPGGRAIGEAPPISEEFRAGRRRKSAVTICGMIAVAAIGQGVYMLGLGPIGLAAAGVTLVGQAIKYNDDAAHHCDEFARTEIRATFRETTQAVQQHVRDNLKPVRTMLGERFLALEQTLDGALQALRNAGAATQPEDPDRRSIEAIRQRILTLTLHAAENPLAYTNETGAQHPA